MTTLEPPDPTCNPESGSVTTGVLKDDTETLPAESEDVADTRTEGREVDNLGGFNDERIENLGRCITPAQPFLRSLIQAISTETP